MPDLSGYISIALTAVTCPKIPSNNTQSDPQSNTSSTPTVAPEPFALQSKLFSEIRVLNNLLSVEIQGIVSGSSTNSSSGVGKSSNSAGNDNNGKLLLGTFLHPKVINTNLYFYTILSLMVCIMYVML